MRTVLGLLFACYACGNLETYHLRPIGFDDHDLGLLRSANAEWSLKTNGQNEFEIDPECNLDICSTIELVEHITDAKDALGLCFAEREMLGMTFHIMCYNARPTDGIFRIEVQFYPHTDSNAALALDSSYWLGDRTRDQAVRTTILHELGHAFGRHHLQPGTVMFWQQSDNQVNYLTENDLLDNGIDNEHN